MTGNILWYSARASGLIAWAIAAASVLWGLALSTRILGKNPRPVWLLDLHRFLGGIAVVFVGVHIVSVMLDSYAHFGLVEILVPLTGSWHPVAVAWGIVAMYLLIAIELTSLLRTRIPTSLWRRVHLASFGVFALTTVHALTAGTDATSGAWFRVIVATTGLVGAMSALRLFGFGNRGRNRHLPRQPHLEDSASA
jgi:predicted ferric reductase